MEVHNRHKIQVCIPVLIAECDLDVHMNDVKRFMCATFATAACESLNLSRLKDPCDLHSKSLLVLQ